MPTPSLPWRKGTTSKAGMFLNDLLAQRTPCTQKRSSPFPSCPRHGDYAVRPQEILPCGHDLRVHVFDDRSAILTHTAQLAILPRPLTFHATKGPGNQRTFSYTDSDQRTRLAEALWQAHARTPPVAHPLDTPQAIHPPQGTVWLPYDRFSTQTTLAYWGAAPQEREDQGALSQDATGALVGFLATFFPQIWKNPGRVSTIFRSFWDPEATLPIAHGQAYVQLPARARRMLLAAIPEIGAAAGTGLWRPASPTHSSTHDKGAVSIHMPADIPSAHQRIAAQGAWRARLDAKARTQWDILAQRHACPD